MRLLAALLLINQLGLPGTAGLGGSDGTPGSRAGEHDGILESPESLPFTDSSAQADL
ncbi:MAG: hypothetical protein M1296_07085 [Chloroflexi bacterium]|nr:hypothetical protein [Chloroflexota bacterium]